MGLSPIQLFKSNESNKPTSQCLLRSSTTFEQIQQMETYDELVEEISKNRENQLMRKMPSFKTIKNPFYQRIGRVQFMTQTFNWIEVFKMQPILNTILDFLNIQELETIKLCGRWFRRGLLLKVLQNNNNWNLTFYKISPYLAQQTPLKQSQVDEDYEHSEDLDRTSGYFENQNQEDITEHQCKLNRIMTTISFKIEYFQGIMPICANLLQCFNQQTSYWLLRYLLFKVNHIQNDIQFYQTYLNQLDEQLKVILPDIYRHLQSCGFEINYFAMKWIMGLFSQDMSKTMVLSFWDFIFQTDVYSMMYFIIALFSQFSNEILSQKADQINQLLKNNLKERLSKLNTQNLIRHAKNLYIERRLKMR